MGDKIKEGCVNGLVFEELDGIKLGDIYQFDPHRFSDYYQQYMVVYLYKAQGKGFAQIVYDDGFIEPCADTATIKTDKFIKNVEFKNKVIDYSVLKRVKKHGEKNDGIRNK